MTCTFEDKFMVNPINDLANSKPIDSEGRLKHETKSTEKLDLSYLTSESNVSLSQTCKELDALKASLMDTPEANKARIEYLKDEIKSGSYEPNSSKIALKMLNALETA